MEKVLNEKAFTKMIRLKKPEYGNKVKTGAIHYDDSHYLFTDGIIVAKVKEKTLTEKMKMISDFNEKQLRQVEKIFKDYEEKNLDEEELELLTDYTLYFSPYYKQDKFVYVLKGKSNGVILYLDRNFVDPILPYNPKFYATEDFSPVAVKIGNKMYALIHSIRPSDSIIKKVRKDLENA